MSQRCLCITLFALVVSAAIAPSAAHAEDATVPCVVGLSLDKAQSLLEQAGFTGSVQHVQGRTIGVVFSQTPGGLTLKDLERRAIVSALEDVDGNRRKAAKRLGIALRTLQYKIKDYGIS